MRTFTNILLWFAAAVMLDLTACGLLTAAEPAGKPSTRFPGADAWGEVRFIPGPMPAGDFAIASGGTEIAFYGYTRAYHIYDITRGRVTSEVKCPDESVHDLCYSPDGKRLITAEWTKGVKVRDSATGRVLETFNLEGNLGAFYTTFITDRKLAAYCWHAEAGQGSKMHEQLAVWDLTTNKSTGWAATERVEAKGEMIRRHFVAGGRYLLSIETKRERGYVVARSATLTDPATNKTGAKVALDMDDDFVFDASPDGRTLLVFNLNRPPRLVDVETGKTRKILIGHQQYVTCGAFSPDGKLIATTSGSTRRTNLAPKEPPARDAPTEIILWDTSTGEKIASLRDTMKTHDFSKIKFSADGKFVAAMTAPDAQARKGYRGGDMILWGKLPPVGETEPATAVRAEPFALSDQLDRFITELSASNKTVDQKVEAIFLVVLGRFPTEEERTRATRQFGNKPPDAAGLKRLVESLTETREFRDHVEALQKRLASEKPGGSKP